MLDEYLKEFEVFAKAEGSTQESYQALLNSYEGMKYEIANLLAYSANSKNKYRNKYKYFCTDPFIFFHD